VVCFIISSSQVTFSRRNLFLFSNAEGSHCFQWKQCIDFMTVWKSFILRTYLSHIPLFCVIILRSCLVVVPGHQNCTVSSCWCICILLYHSNWSETTEITFTEVNSHTSYEILKMFPILIHMIRICYTCCSHFLHICFPSKE